LEHTHFFLLRHFSGGKFFSPRELPDRDHRAHADIHIGEAYILDLFVIPVYFGFDLKDLGKLGHARVVTVLGTPIAPCFGRLYFFKHFTSILVAA